MDNTAENSTSFRDQVSTISKEGKRNWIFPKKPSGKFYNLRTIVSIILLLILFGTPFIKVHGHQFVQFDILNRNFILLGIPFGPHDFHLFVIAMIAFIVFIILFTAAFGRVFCGWICPQTIFMEMVFRKIEYWIEGDANKQRALKKAPWNKEKIIKKGSKHIIFFLLAFIISNFFLSYIIGMDALSKIISDPPSEHLQGLASILAFSGVFYWVFSYFREQACTMICPYGRLQGVLLDQDSVVIAYDYLRGEPRGKISKIDTAEKKGDCIDCKLCVEVCPTGIDIRNGFQMECVNCTACIDACNYVMKKVKRPTGLIRYDTLNGLEKGRKFHFTPRMLLYSIILVGLLSLLSYLMANRTDFSISILRTPGLLYQEESNNNISNIYDLNIVNKTYNEVSAELKLENIKGELKVVGDNINLKPQEISDYKFIIILPKDEIKKINTPIVIGVYAGNKLLEKVNTSFLGPVKEKEIEK